MRRAPTMILVATALLLSALFMSNPTDAQAPAPDGCPAGYQLSNGSCIADEGPACADDFTFVGASCRQETVATLGLACPLGPGLVGDMCLIFVDAQVADSITICPIGTVVLDGSCYSQGSDPTTECPDGFSIDDSLGGLCARFEPAEQLPPTCPEGSRGTAPDCYILVARGPVGVTCIEGELRGNVCVIVGQPPVRQPDVCPTGLVSGDACYEIVPADPESLECPIEAPSVDGECRRAVEFQPGPFACPGAGFAIVAGECITQGTIEFTPAICPVGSVEDADGNCRRAVAQAEGDYVCPDEAARNGRYCVFTAASVLTCAIPAELILRACRVAVDEIPILPCAPQVGAPAETYCVYHIPVEQLVCESPAALLINDTCLELRPTNCAADVLDGRCISVVAPLVPDSIRGTVRNIETGEVVFGAQVCARRNFPELTVCGYSTRTGVFLITDLPTANYQLFATDPSQRYELGCFGLATCDDPQYVGLGQFSLDSVNIWLEPRFSFAPTPPPVPTPNGVPQSDADCEARNPEFPYFHPADGLCYADPIPPGPTPVASPTPIPGIECPPGTFLWEDGQCYPIPGATVTPGPTPTVTPTATPVAECPPGLFPWEDGLCYPPGGPTVTPSPVPTVTPDGPTPTPTVTPEGPTPTPSPTATPFPVTATPTPTGEPLIQSTLSGFVTRAGLAAPLLETVCAEQPLIGGRVCTSTDVIGFYEFIDLPTGNYVISVNGTEACHGTGSSCSDPTPIGMVAGTARRGIDIALDPVPQYSSTVYTLTAQVPVVQLFDGPNGAPINASFDDIELVQVNPTVFGNPLTYRVITGRPDIDTGWAEVHMYARPNDQTAWVQTQSFVWGVSETEILIDLGIGQVSVRQGPVSLLESLAEIGGPDSQTPHGDGWVQEILLAPAPHFGSLLLPLGLFSEDLNSFAGSVPAIALSGTNAPDLLGTTNTSGAVRIANADIERIAELVTQGAVVTIGSSVAD